MPSSNTNKGKTSSVERILQIILGAAVLFLLFVVASWFYSNTISAPTRGTQQAAYTQQAANVIATAIRQAYKTPTKAWTPTPTPIPTPVPVVLYSDDFSDKQSGWQDTEGFMPGFYDLSRYSGGQYVMERVKGDNTYIYECAQRTFSDAVLTVDTFLVSGSAIDAGPMIVWRYINAKNFYALTITPGNSSYSIGKRFDGNWQTGAQFGWANSDTINRGNQYNKIAISFSGGTSTIYINDKYLQSIQDSEFASGDICLGTLSSKTSAIEVSFDNLVIYTTDSWTPPK